VNDVKAGLDLNIVSDLADQLECPALALAFLRDFLALLPGRMERIRASLIEQDPEKALEAVLSLKTTAAMTGTHRIEACCRTVEQLIRANRFVQAEFAARELDQLVSGTVTASQSLLGGAHTLLLPANPILIQT
jgi:HPt (histidine-containing phosphotransfer) domain-containing protein